MEIYVGVKFIGEEEDLAIVNKKWLTPRKSEVFWPPYKQQRDYEKALKSGELPVEGVWELYGINKCYFESGKCKCYNRYLGSRQVLDSLLFCLPRP